MAGLSIGLFAVVFLQVSLGYKKTFWLHVPIGVGIFGSLYRKTICDLSIDRYIHIDYR